MNRARLLIVEDEADTALMLKKALERGPYVVDIAYTGAECLEFLKKNTPDILILDSFLPDMDGVQLCAAIRSEPGSRDIPIIMMISIASSVSAFGRQGFDGIGLPTDEILEKPIDPNHLMERIVAVLMRGYATPS